MVLWRGLRTAIVTGGAGFIGSAVTSELLRRGLMVLVVGGSADPITAERLAPLMTDTLDVIVHCAGTSSVGAAIANPVREHERTVPPFARLCAAARERAPNARVVLISSAAVYGNAAIVPTPEAAPLAPLSPYGRDKQACEAIAQQYGASIVRLFSVYGAGLRKQLLWDACNKVGAPVFAGTGDEQRDWLHISDAVELILIAAKRPMIVNGGTGGGVRVRDVLALLYKELGGGVTPSFTGETRAGDPQRYIADITLARSLGWAPKMSLARGIADYVAWFRS
ncbi:MAG: SDR family oxidoreductase [Kofleriaceae bacterium]